jgi:hypothetical protein
MKTDIHIWLYLAQFFLDEKYEKSGNSCRGKQNTFYDQYFFLRKSCHLWDNVKKYCKPDRPKRTTWRMRIACWIPKAIQTQIQNMLHLLLFHCNNGCTNAPQCYVILYVHCLCFIFLIWQHKPILLIPFSVHNKFCRLLSKTMRAYRSSHSY